MLYQYIETSKSKRRVFLFIYEDLYKNNPDIYIKNMIKLGYDGLISDDNVFLVFHPNQIKSAIGNDGSWDINDNNIYS
jgi:hypothetical protein